MLTIYTTCPAAINDARDKPGPRLADVIAWTEESGCDGILIFADNMSHDPWVVASMVLAKSDTLVPLVAANPIYQHPVSVAKIVNSVATLSGRRIDINLVTGGFSRHLTEMGCSLGHRERYDRLAEFGTIIAELTSHGEPLKYAGSYYRLNGVHASPAAAVGLEPRFYVSGASRDCQRVQQLLGVTRLCYPLEPGMYRKGSSLVDGGIRLGIIVRDDSGAAWRLAHEQFPVDPVGEEFHELAYESIESHWHRQLSEYALRSSAPVDAYWMYPFRAYKTYCPYIVGSYSEVVDLLVRYLTLGVTTFILDEPRSQADLHHSVQALRIAQSRFKAL